MTAHTGSDEGRLSEAERGLIQIEVAALRAGHVHMRDVFGVVERILTARAAAPDALRHRVEALVLEWELPLAGARQRANTSEDFFDIAAEESLRDKHAQQLRAALRQTYGART